MAALGFDCKGEGSFTGLSGHEQNVCSQKMLSQTWSTIIGSRVDGEGDLSTTELALEGIGRNLKVLFPGY